MMYEKSEKKKIQIRPLGKEKRILQEEIWLHFPKFVHWLWILSLKKNPFFSFSFLSIF